MSVADRGQREKLALRQEILAAARQSFAKEGYESVSMRRIAQKIEYSPTTIYPYFRDKDGPIQELCQETFALRGRAVGEGEAGTAGLRGFRLTASQSLPNHISDAARPALRERPTGHAGDTGVRASAPRGDGVHSGGTVSRNRGCP